MNRHKFPTLFLIWNRKSFLFPFKIICLYFYFPFPLCCQCLLLQNDSYWFHEAAIALSLLRLKPDRNLQLSKLRQMIKVLWHRQMLSRKLWNLSRKACDKSFLNFHDLLVWFTTKWSVKTTLEKNVVMVAQLCNCIENGKSLLRIRIHCFQCELKAHLIEFLSQNFMSKFKWISKAYDGNFTSAHKSLWIKQTGRKIVQ